MFLCREEQKTWMWKCLRWALSCLRQKLRKFSVKQSYWSKEFMCLGPKFLSNVFNSPGQLHLGPSGLCIAPVLHQSYTGGRPTPSSFSCCSHLVNWTSLVELSPISSPHTVWWSGGCRWNLLFTPPPLCLACLGAVGLCHCWWGHYIYLCCGHPLHLNDVALWNSPCLLLSDVILMYQNNGPSSLY